MQMDSPIAVLLVDPEERGHFIIRQLLNSIKNEKYHLKSIFDFQQGISEALSGNFDICLINYNLKNDKAQSFLQVMVDSHCTVPIILLTDYKDSGAGKASLSLGAVDYLNKEEINGPLLERVIRYATERHKIEDKLAKISNQLEYLSAFDLLTGIGNRNQFNTVLPLIVEQCIRNHLSIAIFSLDIDNFSQINDTLGHNAGDLLLQNLVKRLKTNLRKVDTLFRLGGDEFVLVISGLLRKDKIKQLAKKISGLFEAPFMINDHPRQLTASIGVTYSSHKSMRPAESLLKEADIAMYSAKKGGGNNFQFYVNSVAENYVEYFHLIADLKLALPNNELMVYYQPLVSISTNNTIGMEALLRWNHPIYGIISPTVFIPIAEKIGLISAIGEWVLRQACLQKKIWSDLGYTSLLMAVNVSIYQVQQPDFVNKVTDILSSTKIEPSHIELEISESVISKDFEICVKKMTGLRKIGVRFVIDDFGTGYSNLSYLRKFSFDKIKIDKIFIDEITSNKNEQYIVQAIIDMARKMDLEVVAEGVETIEQLEYLRLHHSDQVQGFYYSEPLPPQQCLEFLEQPEKRVLSNFVELRNASRL